MFFDQWDTLQVFVLFLYPGFGVTIQIVWCKSRDNSESVGCDMTEAIPL